VHQSGLDQEIIFKDEVPQNLLAPDIQSADALVLFSKYETFGCVVIEANACGVPAILSDLNVFKEYSIDNKTAVFAKQGDAGSLAASLKNYIDNKSTFISKEIAEYTRSKFSYEVVAQQFDALYQSYLR
jgi:glycosyltransferase involved in cell wall biosynthesis